MRHFDGRQLCHLQALFENLCAWPGAAGGWPAQALRISISPLFRRERAGQRPGATSALRFRVRLNLTVQEGASKLSQSHSHAVSHTGQYLRSDQQTAKQTLKRSRRPCFIQKGGENMLLPLCFRTKRLQKPLKAATARGTVEQKSSCRRPSRPLSNGAYSTAHPTAVAEVVLGPGSLRLASNRAMFKLKSKPFSL